MNSSTSWVVGSDLLVDDGFDFAQFGLGDAGEVAEVEAQAIAVDERASLLDVFAEDLAQGGVEEVSAGVVAHGGGSHFPVDRCIYFIVDCDGLFGDDLVGEDALNGLGCAFDLGDDGLMVCGV